MVNHNQLDSAAYAELLRDLAHKCPASGYTRENLKLTHAQLAVIVAHDGTIVDEAYAETDEQIVGLVQAALAAPECNAVFLAGIGAALINAVRARAPKSILSDVLRACADKSEDDRVDARFEGEAA
jgi:hypothetical protein